MSESKPIDVAVTRSVAQKWFDGMTGGDPDSAFTCLDENVEWINYKIVPGYNDSMPWIGTVHGIEEVKKTGVIFLGMVEVQSEELLELVVEGENAMGVIHEKSVVSGLRCATARSCVGNPIPIRPRSSAPSRGAETPKSKFVRVTYVNGGERGKEWPIRDTASAPG
ncbi:MAG: hypothetical protein P8166_00940 [Candidatus Thiodiazotropha sp.]